MQHHLTKWLIHGVLLLVASAASAQGYRVTQYTKNEGMPTELVKAVAQDKKGYLWIASDEGLMRFDGQKFRLFKKELPNQYVKDIISTQSGRLFATSDDVFHEIITHADHVEFKVIARKSIRENDSIIWYPKQLFEDSHGEVWLSDHFRPYRMVADTIKGYNLPDYDKSHDWQRAYTVTEDGKGNVLIISQPGRWYRYNRTHDRLDTISSRPIFKRVQAALPVAPNQILVSGNRQVHLVKINEREIVSDTVLSNVDASHFYNLGNNEVLVGTWSSGLHKITKNGNAWQVSKINEYPLTTANRLYQSKGGEVWTTSDNGLSLLNHRMFTAPKNFSKKYIQCIRPDFNHNGIYYSDGQKVTHVRKTEKGLNHETVYQKAGQTILQVQPVADGLWISDTDGLILFIDNEGKRKTYDLSRTGGSIFYLKTDTKGDVWFIQDGNSCVNRLNKNGKSKQYGKAEGIVSRPLVLTENGKSLYVGARADSAFLYRYNSTSDRFDNVSRNMEANVSNIGMSVNDMAFDRTRDRLWIGGSTGLYYFQNDTIYRGNLGDESFQAIKSMAVDYNNHLWFGNPNGLIKWQNNKSVVLDEREGIPSKTVSFRTLYVDKQHTVWLGTVAGIAIASEIKNATATPTPFFAQVTREKKLIDTETEHTFYTDEFLSFHFLSPTFPSRSIRYEWRLNKLNSTDGSWEHAEQSTGLVFSKLKSGYYTLQIRALQQGNYLWSEPLSFSFEVAPVWYQRWTVWLGTIAMLALLVFLFIRRYTRSLNHRNFELEREVSLRTAKIVESQRELERANLQLEHANQLLKYQKIALDETAIVSIADTENKINYINDKFCEVSQYAHNELIGKDHLILLSDKHDDAFHQKIWETIQKGKWHGEICNRTKKGSLYWVDTTIVPFIDKEGKPYQFLSISFDITERKESEVQMRQQKDEIELQNNQITSSINYASRIQTALLRPDMLVEEHFSDYFVIFKPLNIVSGDFYWVKKIRNEIVVAVGDCTGHGVPGAFMSILGMTLLNDVTNNIKNSIDPAQVLEGMRDGVKKSLNQKGESREQKDGMDLALCVFDIEKSTMRFAGAFNPVYILSNNELIDLKPTKNPIGVYHKELPFASTEVTVKKGDIIYLFTDGYMDQLNEKGRERLKRHRFKNLILENTHKPLDEQKNTLENSFNVWKGNRNQTDDILVAGIKI